MKNREATNAALRPLTHTTYQNRVEDTVLVKHTIMQPTPLPLPAGKYCIPLQSIIPSRSRRAAISNAPPPPSPQPPQMHTRPSGQKQRAHRTASAVFLVVHTIARL
jgi:hypothetical protein